MLIFFKIKQGFHLLLFLRFLLLILSKMWGWGEGLWVAAHGLEVGEEGFGILLMEMRCKGGL